VSLTSDAFLEKHPEFATGGSLIQSAIDDAKLRLNAQAWGNKYDLAVEMLAAHTLACSPFARTLRLVDDKGETEFSKRFDRMMKARIPRMIVA
jgi:hypothetical protein